MSWFKNRLGLIIWALIWLTIVLVPLWRLRAIRERSGSTLQLLVDKELGLTPELEAEVARRYPNDVNAQLANMRIPINQISPLEFSSQQSSGSTFARKASSYFARYDELERRFPNSNEVRAQRLIDVTRGHLDEHEGPQKVRETYGSPKIPPTTWLAKPELESALRTAKEGTRRDPTNGFFPWMEAVLLFTLNRPNEALQALDHAGRCTRWTDYTANTLLNRIELRGRVRPTGWEDESEEAYAFLLPHYAALRSAARAATGQMRLARGRGDEARALQIAGSLQRAGNVMAHGHDLIITRLVGEVLCSMAWKATVENLSPENKEPPSQSSVAQNLEDTQMKNAQALQGFVAYTRAHGRNDLADEALRIGPTLQTTRLSKFLTTSPFDRLTRCHLSLASAFWLNSWLIQLAFFGSLTWGVSALYTLRSPQKQKANAPIMVWAFFCVGATAMLLAFLTSQGEGRGFIENFMGYDSNASPSPLLSFLRDTLPAILLILWSGQIVVLLLWKVLREWRPQLSIKRESSDPHRVIIWGLWGLVLAFASLIIYNDQAHNRELLTPILLGFFVSVVAASVLYVLWASQSQKWSRVFGIGSLWLAGLAICLSTDGFPLLVICGSLALFSALCSLVLRLRSSASPIQWQPQWAIETAHRLRITTAVLALAATLAYAGVTVWSIPVEHQAHLFLQRQLQLGEGNYLQEQLDQQK